MADYHVNYDKDDEQWKVNRSGGERSSGNFDTQADAIDRANQLTAGSGGGEVNIHRKGNYSGRGLSPSGGQWIWPVVKRPMGSSSWMTAL